MNENESIGVSVTNLRTLETLWFDDKTPPEYALRYAYCYSACRLDWFFECVQDKRYSEVADELPIIQGDWTMGLGDWATLV